MCVIEKATQQLSKSCTCRQWRTTTQPKLHRRLLQQEGQQLPLQLQRPLMLLLHLEVHPGLRSLSLPCASSAWAPCMYVWGLSDMGLGCPYMLDADT